MAKASDLTLELEAPDVANKANKEESARRLAELKQKEGDDTTKGLDTLKGIIERMEGHIQQPSNVAAVQADPTVYPFGLWR
jgi:hypothetical protein